jgi:Sec-independent protein secretion pathway component TatC
MARLNFKKTRGAAFAVFVIAALLCPNTTASAAAQTADLFLLSERSNMAVTIYYDAEEPVVSFIAPNSDIYAEADLEVETGDKSVCYYIPNAMPGQWQIVCDKLSNTALDVNWAPYANFIKITGFEFTPFQGENSTEVAFTVTSETDGRYNYTVYAAVIDAAGNVDGTAELTAGTANVNQRTTARVRVDRLQTYDKYHFFLEVWRAEYGLEASDTAVSSAEFSVVSANAPQMIESVDIEVDLTYSLLSLDWDAYKARCDEYVLAVFDASDISESEPIYANSFTSDNTSTVIVFPPDSERLIVELSYIQNGATSRMLRKEVPIDTGVVFDLPAVGVISAKQVAVAYQADKNVIAEVKVNGKMERIALNGSGNFSVEVDDFDNEVEISYTLEDENTAYILRKMISVDTAPPILYLPENDVTLFVAEAAFDLAGATEIDCVLTVNGEVVPLNEDGTFLKTLDLVDGENEFTVNSSDPAGNIAAQLILINKTRPGEVVGSADTPLWRRYIYLIGSFAASIILLVLALVFTRLYAKNKAVSLTYAAAALVRNMLAALLAMSAAFIGRVVWRYMSLKSIVESERLFDEAKASIAGAYELIKEYRLFSELLRYGIIACVAAAALLAASILLARTLKKRSESL